MQWVQKQKGFTIVELLIVIVVIAILAAITIVAYNGIQNRAKASAVQSDVVNLVKKVEAFKAQSTTEAYPADLAAMGLSSASAEYYYSGNDRTYCVSKVNGDIAYSYRSAQPGTVEGDCGSSGLVARYYLNGNGDAAIGGTLASLTATTAVAGQDGNGAGALNFNGTTSQAVAPSAFGLGNTNLSLAAWVYSGSATNKGAFVKLGNVAGANSSTGGIGLGMGTVNFDNAGTNLIAIYENVRWIVSTGTITPNTWVHVAVSIDGSGTPSFFVNGERTGVYPGTVAQAPSVQSTVIGGYGGARWFTGRIDDVRIYNRAVTGGEFKAMYAMGAQ